MKTLYTLFVFIVIFCSNLFSQPVTDSSFSCGFQYDISDSLMVFGYDAYELFTRSDCRDESVYHKWNLSNGLESDERDPNFVINASDSIIEVCHKIVNTSEIFCEHCEVIYHFPVIQPACKADFYFFKDTSTNCNCLAVYQFNDLSDDDNVSWLWTFGDGDSSHLQNPIHEFQDSGFYRINLRITNAEGCQAEKTRYLIIRSNDNCNLQLGYYTLESAPPQYQFYSGIYDPRLIMSHKAPESDSAWYNALQYYWDLGDGTNSGEPFVNHTYYKSGTYKITLQIVYADGFTCNAELSDYFTGQDSIISCNFNGVFYRNYNGFGIDAVVMDYGQILHVKQIIPKINIPDKSIIRFGFKEAGDTLYIGDQMFPSIIINCVEMENECNLTGTVKDYTGLDGCGYLIELDNGTRLEPVIVHDSIKFYDNQRVKLSYIERKDMASICMAGIMAEITCIKEIKPDTLIPPHFCEQIMLNTSFVLNGSYCNGSASVEVVTPCNAWMYYEMIMNTNYKILWSTGETTKTIYGLCPGTLYFVTVTNPITGKTYTAAFSIFNLNNIFPSWNFTQNENSYLFNLPVDSTYFVSWKFDDGITQNGSSASHTFNSGGNHQVELTVKDNSGNLLYSQTIQFSVPVNILQPKTESLDIFPNPVTDFLNVSLPDHLRGNFTVSIYNFSGQAVSGQNISDINQNHIKIDVSALSRGLYLLVITNVDGTRSVKFEKR